MSPHDRLRMRFIGTAPLLMRAGRMADPLDEHAVALARITSKRAKTTSDHALIARLEWRGSLWLSAGLPCVPAEAIEASLAAAGRTRRLGAVVRAAVVVQESPIVQHGGPDDVEALFDIPAYVHRSGVRVNNRRTMRTRPRFEAWQIDVDVDFMPSAIDAADLLELADIAGQMVGLGDFRPRFGRFRSEPIG